MVAQPVGYLVDLMADEVRAEFMTGALHISRQGVRYRDLSPSDSDGVHDERRHVIVDADIEHDL